MRPPPVTRQPRTCTWQTAWLKHVVGSHTAVCPELTPVQVTVAWSQLSEVICDATLAVSTACAPTASGVSVPVLSVSVTAVLEPVQVPLFTKSASLVEQFRASSPVLVTVTVILPLESHVFSIRTAGLGTSQLLSEFLAPSVTFVHTA